MRQTQRNAVIVCASAERLRELEKLTLEHVVFSWLFTLSLRSKKRKQLLKNKQQETRAQRKQSTRALLAHCDSLPMVRAAFAE
jgi:hypothetical protein